MDAPPIMREKLGTKICDFAFGSLLVGGVPAATYWLLAFLSHWPCDLVFYHYGDLAAFRLQMVFLTIAFLAAFLAFIFIVWWRMRHRLLPAWLLAFEAVIGILLAFFYFAYIALLYGPTDA